MNPIAIINNFNELIEKIEKTSNPKAKQKLFDEYQGQLMFHIDICGEENFDFFKELCRDKLNITEEK